MRSDALTRRSVGEEILKAADVSISFAPNYRTLTPAVGARDESELTAGLLISIQLAP